MSRYARHTTSLLVVALALVVSLVAASSAAPLTPVGVPGVEPAGPRVVPRRVLVELADGIASGITAPTASADVRGQLSAAPALESLNADLRATRMTRVFEARPAASGATRIGSTSDYRRRFFAVEFDAAVDVLEIARRYREAPGVVSAQPDYVYEPDAIPNDTDYPLQYAHLLTHAEAGWDLATGDPGLVIAVVGTGVQRSHPDLSANTWENLAEIPGNALDDDFNGYVDDRYGWDFEDDDADPSPMGDPHETRVAGVAAADTDNGLGVAGVCWSCQLMALRVAFTSTDVALAIDYASANGARVINMSFGNYDPGKYGPDGLVESAVDAAFAAGAVLVATAGNNALQTRRYPAALANVIATASTTASDARSGSSNYGSWVSLAAPGSDIQTTTTGGGTTSTSGTSFAAPYVSGLAALLLSKDPSLTPSQVRLRIEYSVDKITPDFFIGTGRVNVENALSLSAEPDLFAVIKSPLHNAIANGPLQISGTALGDPYTLEYRPAGSGSYSVLASGADVIDAVLGVLDLTPLADGEYEVRLTAERGGDSQVDTISVFRQGDVKPGWPIENGGSFVSSPSFADLDGDGDLEIFIGNNTGQVYAWHHDAAPVAGWPQNGDLFMFGSPAIGDIDGDGDLEVVQTSFSTGQVSVWHHDGEVVPGWPLVAGRTARGAAVLVDLDGDGAAEIVVAGAGNSTQPNSGKLHAWRSDASELPGFPVGIPFNVQTTPAVGDVDGDGDVEIVVHTGSELLSFHHDGSAVSGGSWTLSTSHSSPLLADLDGDGDDEVISFGSASVTARQGDGTLIFSTPTPGGSLGESAAGLGDVDGDGRAEICIGDNSGGVWLVDGDGAVFPGWPLSTGLDAAGCSMADLDADGLQEVIATSRDALVHAWNADATIVAGGWPKSASQAIYGAAGVGDIDADGALELLVGNGLGDFFVYDLGAAAGEEATHWPMFHGGPRNTGRFAFSDADGDGVIDRIEDEAPNGGDANDDGQLDRLQGEVASLVTRAESVGAPSGEPLTVSLLSGCGQLRDVRAMTEAEIASAGDSAYEYPRGLVGFRVACASATVELAFHDSPTLAGPYRKFGPTTPGDPLTESWYELSTAVFGSKVVAGQTVATVTLSLADGALGDATGLDAEIVDPGGPAVATASVPALPVAGLLLGFVGIVLAVFRRIS